MSSATLDRVLATLVIAMAATGLLSLRAGSLGAAWIYTLHAVLAGALLGATLLKLRRSVPKAARAGRFGRLALGLLVSLGVLASLSGGFLWVASGEPLSVGSWTVLTLHAWVGLAVVPLVAVHLLPHRWRLLRVPASRPGSPRLARRTVLAGSALAPEGFDAKLRASPAMEELHRVRNVKPGFKKGLWLGMLNAAWETVTAGRSPWTLRNRPDWCSLEKLDGDGAPDRPYVPRDLAPRDRLAGVYFAATEHDEDQPVHLVVHDTDVCVTRCAEEYANPCTRFCPAGVYEIVEDADAKAGKRLQINAANCVHCKTCDIKDPYEIITWVTPEGGAGPNYQNL